MPYFFSATVRHYFPSVFFISTHFHIENIYNTHNATTHLISGQINCIRMHSRWNWNMKMAGAWQQQRGCPEALYIGCLNCILSYIYIFFYLTQIRFTELSRIEGIRLMWMVRGDIECAQSAWLRANHCFALFPAYRIAHFISVEPNKHKKKKT